MRQCKTAPDHDCRKNWSHSSKAMEADIAVQLHTDALSSGLVYAKVIGDEDSSAICHIREKVNSNVEKYSDLSHIKRSLSRKLDELHKSHKQLTSMVKVDFLKNFSYAVRQNNNGSEEDMKKALTAAVEHMFGKHELCKDWCKHGKVDGYKHGGLPYGKDLTDETLKDALFKLLAPYIDNPKKFLTSGSSQHNESLNNIAWSKVPKFRNYNQSESFDYRCAAAVLQYNEGVEYVSNICDKSLSPRKETQFYCTQRDNKRKYHHSYQKSKKQKKRRIQLKKDRKRKDKTSEIKLGSTYESDMLNENNIDITEIPDDIPEHKIDLEAGEATHIFVDIETTKLGYDAEITQVSAVCGNETFTRYILPKGQITPEATQVTGLKVEVINGTRILTLKGQPVASVTVKEGLSDFIHWLTQLHGKKVLIAHNGEKFDFPILISHMQKLCLLDSFSQVVTGVVDTLPYFRKNIQSDEGYKLSTIYRIVCNGRDDELHNAEFDVAKELHRSSMWLVVDVV